MDLKNVIFCILFLAAVCFFIWSIRNKIRNLLTGRKQDNRFDNAGDRLKRVMSVAFAQTKIMRDAKAGILHVVIFWGFILFVFAVLEAIIQGFYTPFSLAFTGPVYSAITIIQDIFGLLVIAAVLYALYRRFVLRVPRLEVDRHGKADAALILLLIMGVCLSMFGQNVSLVALNNFNMQPYEIRPVSKIFAGIIYNSSESAAVPYEIFWWMHIIIVLVFLNLLPYSKHFHIITAIPNIYFARLSPYRDTLQSLNLEDENTEVFGAADIEHLSWKQMLDGYTCTECGRCSNACPASTAGKSLSPREIIVSIRQRTEEKASLLSKGIPESSESRVFEKTLVHDYITDKELWQCTTCNACVQECPVMIEHVDSIVDMRRNLVLTESNFPSNLNNVFKSIENNYTPWAFNSADRANWAEGLGIKTMAEDPGGEILFWVGCAGSYDDRYKKVSRALAKLMQKAKIDFRILGNEEKCNGDTARRLGNEYLAQMMMTENIETLNNYGVKKIVTACPHCFHSLGREYKQFGGNYEVIHHTQLISDLLKAGKIELKDESVKKKITYHDSCYLGRYNEVYEQPRSVIKSIMGAELIEMKRNRSRGFCCGAGGGRMFLEDDEGEKINIERTKEAVATTADTIASACPFCMTMLTDGVKHFEKNEEIEVKDIAELVLESSK